MPAEIGTLWIGGALSWMEQLCLQSFVDNGHHVTLYCYDAVGGVPDGVHIADAAQILPTDAILRHARTGSPAYHADIFRLQMMMKTDKVWADTDAYCVRPWEVATDAPFYGWISDDVEQVNNGVLRLPRGSATLARMIEFAADPYPIPPWLPAPKQERLAAKKAAGQGVHVSELPWGVLGPDALTHFLKETGEIAHAQPGHVIYPVPFRTAGMLLNPNRREQTERLIREDTLSIHFWGRRFRNVAAATGGLPEPGAYMRTLLERHGIAPGPTADRLRKPARAEGATALNRDLDFSMFDDLDVAQVVLQRSEVIESEAQIKAWMAGDEGPLMDLARSRRDAILLRAFEAVRQACERAVPAIDGLGPRRIADIGCGYGFADLILHHRYGCDLLLIDIESNPHRHFGFAPEGAGYASLSKARAFLEANGVAPDKIVTLNPGSEALGAAGAVDLALSQISCGFHYPVDTYEDFFRQQVSPEGGVLLDVRRGSGGVRALKQIGAVEVLERADKYATVLARKEAVVA